MFELAVCDVGEETELDLEEGLSSRSVGEETELDLEEELSSRSVGEETELDLEELSLSCGRLSREG